MKILLMCAVFTCMSLSFNTATAQPAATQENAADTALPFEVMSFNIRWGGAADPPSVWSKRRDRVLETIKAYDPDILGVQEAILRQVKFLRDNMDGYVFFGAGRDNGQLAGEMCAIYYRRDRFRRIGGGHFWLSEEPDTPGSYGWGAGLFPRMVSWLRLRDKADGSTFVVANTHFDHLSKKARLNSAKLLRETIAETAGDDPVVILGDFNCDEDSKPYAALLEPGEGDMPWLIDAYREIHPDRSDQEATYHGFRGVREGSRIDWVLHSPAFQALEAGIDTTHQGLKYPSDHYPVTATLRRVASPRDKVTPEGDTPDSVTAE